MQTTNPAACNPRGARACLIALCNLFHFGKRLATSTTNSAKYSSICITKERQQRLPLSLCFVACILHPSIVLSQADSPAEYVQPLVNQTTIVVASVDLSKWKLPDTLQSVLKDSSTETPGLTRLLRLIDQESELLRDCVGSQPIVALVDVPFSEAQVPIRIAVSNEPDLDREKLAALLKRFAINEPATTGDFIVASPMGDITISQKTAIANSTPSTARPELVPAFAAAEAYPVQLLIIPPEYLRRTYDELMPNLPRKLGGGPTSILTNGLRWIAIGLEPATFKVDITIQSSSAVAAEQLVAYGPTLATRLAALLPELKLGELQATITTIAPLIEPKVVGNQVKISIDGLGEAIQNALAVSKIAERMIAPLASRSMEYKLKQLGLAIHNYYSTNNAFPPAAGARGDDGRSGLSWRVHILPYLDELELYRKFNLNEPWDSPNNHALLEQMPEVYQSTLRLDAHLTPSKPGYTTLVAPVGEGTIFGGTQPLTFDRITDGSSNTAMVVEVKPERSVPWTAPQDYEFDETNPAHGLESDITEHYLMLLGDGAVQRFPQTMAAETLLHIFQRNDGQPIQY